MTLLRCAMLYYTSYYTIMSCSCCRRDLPLLYIYIYYILYYIILYYIILYYIILYYIILYYIFVTGRGFTASFHNFKSQISNRETQILKGKCVAYLSVLSRISNCQSLGRKNEHEILKTYRSWFVCVNKWLSSDYKTTLPLSLSTYIYIYIILYIYIYMYMCVYVYIYIYRERERYTYAKLLYYL